MRSHAPAERSAAGDERQIRRQSRGLRYSGANRGMAQRGRIRPPALSLHVGELIAQGRDAPLRESRGNTLHGWVLHPHARSVGQDEHRPRGPGSLEQAGYTVGRTDADRQALFSLRTHVATLESKCSAPFTVVGAISTNCLLQAMARR